MKKVFTFMASCLMVLAASAQNYELRTLTFEDNDYVGDEANYLGHQTDFWSSLIDNPQYGGTLLYGENHGDTTKTYTATNYKWYDKGNTYLYSELPTNWGTTMYWGGGHAISNYWNGNLSEGTYLNQLAVYTPNTSGSGTNGAGHNGSNNFCVHYGYHDNSGFSADNLPFFLFKDNVERTINGMYINITTYLANCIINGNTLTSKLGSTDYIRLTATGYKLNGTTTSTTFNLAYGSYVTTTWTYWDLSSLGDVYKVEFNVGGSSNNGYGFSQPAYFCYDDVAVRIPTSSSSRTKNAPIARAEENDNNEKMMSACPDVNEFYMLGDIPEGVTYSYTSDNHISIGRHDTGQSSDFVISGMPENAKITKIEWVGLGDFLFASASASAYIGETEIASQTFRGILVEDGAVQIDQVSGAYELNIHEGVSTYCTDDIHLKTHSNSDETLLKYYNIYYTIDTTTGISEVGSAEAAPAVYYTLQGMRVTTPVKGQVYVKNGHKVVF
ncbi:MAG: DUF4465 domain-containing protein [Prevotella sp.]|nr:DUF4465 domain-containing protein [Prevotella sp.]